MADAMSMMCERKCTPSTTHVLAFGRVKPTAAHPLDAMARRAWAHLR
jgi:hypothetical protein